MYSHKPVARDEGRAGGSDVRKRSPLLLILMKISNSFRCAWAALPIRQPTEERCSGICSGEKAIIVVVTRAEPVDLINKSEASLVRAAKTQRRERSDSIQFNSVYLYSPIGVLYNLYT